MKRAVSSELPSSTTRATFSLRLDWCVVTSAFVAAAAQSTSFAEWLEEALRLKLVCENASSSALAAEVAAFCDVADAEPERLPECQRRVYAKLAAAWERYWIVPPVSVGMMEDGVIQPEDALPYLNRQRIAQDWPALTAALPSVLSSTGR